MIKKVIIASLLVPAITLFLVLILAAGGGGSSSSEEQSMNPIADFNGQYLWPTLHQVVTSDFGMRYDPINFKYTMHLGTDLQCFMDEPIYSIEAGKIISEYEDGYGALIIKIAHTDGRSESLYAHLNAYSVPEGEEVVRGQMIGTCGSTGWSTGPHLHLELKIDGSRVDPFLYLTNAIILDENK